MHTIVYSIDNTKFALLSQSFTFESNGIAAVEYVVSCHARAVSLPCPNLSWLIASTVTHGSQL